MYCLLSISDVFPGNWEQFLSGLVATIVGTLIGIFGPFWLQSHIDKKKKRARAIEILKNIKIELLDVLGQFKTLDKKLAHISPIKIPEWNGLMNTNEIELLSSINIKKSKSNIPGDWVKQLFNIYDLINEYNQWWNIYTDKAASGRTRDDLRPIYDNGIIKLHNELSDCENSEGKIIKGKINNVIEIITNITTKQGESQNAGR